MGRASLLTTLAALLCLFVRDSAAEGAAPAPSAKRKFCNSTMPGDYRYEACGEFCKSVKAKNHCQYCKCRTCTFCTADMVQTSKSKTRRLLKKKGPFEKKKKKGGVKVGTPLPTTAGAGAVAPPVMMQKKKKKGGGKGKGKGMGLKKRRARVA